MEALYDGGTHESLTVVGSLKIPEMLSYLATHDVAGYVPGINNILLGGYTLPDGSQALSVMEKMERGKLAISALDRFPSGKGRKKMRTVCSVPVRCWMKTCLISDMDI